ncbi:MAG: signal peptidase I [Sedimentisphaerales bacterium]|nr:signal peptidase I [Sedimentisphaerales bacterium]
MLNEQYLSNYPIQRRSTTIASIAETLEWVMVALILAFIFRAFLMEAFRIPTGSMAETLSGEHFHIRCTRCGFKYDVGADSYHSVKPRCSSCGYTLPEGTPRVLMNGDRVLVLKCIYQFADPKRWDVVVFKNPTNPCENYIKRLIALPGEMVEIIDGDIYIDGVIARKPVNVQHELWMPIYNNDYQPSRQMLDKTGRLSNNPKDEQKWQLPFKNIAGSTWELDADGTVDFLLDSKTDQVNLIYYDSDIGNDFDAKYAYNGGSDIYRATACSDLKIDFQVKPGSVDGFIGAVLEKYGVFYRGRVDLRGHMVLEKIVDGESRELSSRSISKSSDKDVKRFSFANVDHQLILEFGKNRLKYDLGKGPEDAGEINTEGQPQVQIFGAGKLKLSHVALYRDIYYTGRGNLRAGEGDPFTLKEDEFFVCGDNSPSSSDARLWAIEGIGNNGTKYRMGTVPRDYLIGKAFFRYWADANKLFGNLPVVPSIGKIGFIEGGGGDGF